MRPSIEPWDFIVPVVSHIRYDDEPEPPAFVYVSARDMGSRKPITAETPSGEKVYGVLVRWNT